MAKRYEAVPYYNLKSGTERETMTDIKVTFFFSTNTNMY